MNLIQLQQQAVDEILRARTQGPRAAGYGFTLLNKSGRVISGIRKRFVGAALKLDYSPSQIGDLWGDVCDMAKLEANAEEVA